MSHWPFKVVPGVADKPMIQGARAALCWRVFAALQHAVHQILHAAPASASPRPPPASPSPQWSTRARPRPSPPRRCPPWCSSR
jgi:hypothetical protein